MLIVRLIRMLVFTLGFGAALWLCGLFVFAEHVHGLRAAAKDTNREPVDAIVVLTGGSERVKTGIELLKQGYGKQLFISGVHQGLSLDQVLGRSDVSPELRACCIVLGHAAESTEGNAEETQNWFALKQYHSLLLVTSNYHMPRSLLLFHAYMPDAAITPHPIAPETVLLNTWWRHAGTANLLVTEYDKYLFAWLNLRLGAP